MSTEARRASRAAVLALVLLVAAGIAQPAPASFQVRYRSATSVYLDGGRAQGLAVGDRLAVRSGRDQIAELEVVYVAENSAACRVVRETRAVKPGDSAVLLGKETAAPASPTPSPSPEPTTPPAAAPAAAAAPPASAAPAPAAVPSSATPAPRPWARAWGGVSLGYWKSWDDTPAQLDFSQSTLRADLTLSDLWGHPLTFAARLRSRRDARSRELSTLPKSERLDRLYELSLRYQPPSDRYAWELGRIGVSRFVGIGYLDGALARVRLAGPLHVGGFFGRRADVDGLDLAGSGTKYGGFLRLAPASGYGWGGYEALGAYVREFDAEGDISREYVSLEGRGVASRSLTLFGRGEIDLNRDWREAVSASSTQLSNLSLSANLRLSPSVTGALSYDQRRNFRDADTRTVPEQLFDTLLHQGLRASFTYNRARGPYLAGNFGLRFREGDQDKALSYGGSIGHGNLWGLSLGLDGYGYTNSFTSGYLVSARAGKRFGTSVSLDVSAGTSRYDLRAGGPKRSTQWLRGVGRVELGHGLGLAGDVEYNRGDDAKGPRAFAELGYRF